MLFDKNKTTLIYVPNNKQGTLNISAETTIREGALSYSYGISAIEVAEDHAAYSSQGGILYNKQKTQIIRVPRKHQGEVTIADGVTSIAEYTFSGCIEVTSITIPASVTKISRDSFRECSALTTVTMLGGVTVINNCTLYNCANLTMVVIPKSVTEIGKSAFYNCTNLTALTYEGSKSEWNKVTNSSSFSSFTITYLNK